MSFGLGTSSGINFSVNSHIPTDGAIGISRKPTISFILSSLDSDVRLDTISLSINDELLIVNGIFAANVIGNIDGYDLRNVVVSATIINALSPSLLINTEVDALNTDNEFPSTGGSWFFTVDSAIETFIAYVIRSYQRIFRVG